MPGAARSADLEALTKYFAFIEAFRHFFEYRQAEAQLPEFRVQYARSHIGDRRAVIFAGLNEAERKKISDDSVAKKWEMVENVL